MKVVIVDYGMGNIRSIASTLRYIGVDEVTVSADYDELKRSDKIILPGVGSFGKAMHIIKDRKVDIYLDEICKKSGKPLLGICLGMQLLGTSSTEDGFNNGLGFVNAEVVRFDTPGIKVPHVGMNQVQTDNNKNLYRTFPETADFYFTHSYKMISDEDIGQGMCEYGGNFIASFEVGNITGVQFHPELSQTNGIKLLKNFIEKF